MSIIDQLKKKNNGKLLTTEDLENSWRAMWVDPKTVKEITLNEKLLPKTRLRIWR